MNGKIRAVFWVSVFILTVAFANAAETPSSATPAKPHGDYLELDGSRIYYEQGGSGPVIVLLHDGLIHAIAWDGLWDSLCATHRVIRYDRRGYGRSDAPTKPFSSTDDLFKLLNHLEVQHAIIVGSSSGGALAIDFALEHPKMVDGLFLIGPVVHGMRDTAYFQERGKKNNEPGDRGDMKAVAENWSKDKFLIADGHEEARKKIYDALAANPQNLQWNGKLEIRPSAATRLREIKAPTFIQVGEADIADVHAYVGAINNGIRESVRSVVKEAGHFIQLERPEEVLKKLTPFAQRVERKQAILSPDELKSYAGQYKLGDTVLTITVEDNHLLGQIGGEGDFFLFPESPSKFFARLQEADAEFEKDSSGKVSQLVIHQAGAAIRWQRV
jgi:pimeloyl-ACP methyl ester carboxylesterase